MSSFGGGFQKRSECLFAIIKKFRSGELAKFSDRQMLLNQMLISLWNRWASSTPKRLFGPKFKLIIVLIRAKSVLAGALLAGRTSGKPNGLKLALNRKLDDYDLLSCGMPTLPGEASTGHLDYLHRLHDLGTVTSLFRIATVQVAKKVLRSLLKKITWRKSKRNTVGRSDSTLIK